jgi:competence protein CoiA
MEDINNPQLEQELISDKDHDSRISRCYGLMARTALKKSDNSTVFAGDINKFDGPFYCPVCLSEAIVRKCSEKVDHFAHHARQSPVIRKKDKELHTKCIEQILQHLQMAFPDGKWEKEREIKENKERGFKKVVPDISGRIGDIPVAVEVQASAYTINRIKAKIEEYEKRTPKLAVLYIIPLIEDLDDEPFRPRLFEKFLHSMYFGRVYYWTNNNPTELLPVHFSPAKRWIEENTWFDTELREERTEGGFYLTYRTVKMPNYGNSIDISKDFTKVERKAFEPKNVKKAVPKCTIFKDKLRSWWDKNEFKNLSDQFTILKDNKVPDFLQDYEYLDDYDDDFEEEFDFDEEG